MNFIEGKPAVVLTRFVFGILFLAAGVGAALAGAHAADKREILGSFRDWDAVKLTESNGNVVCSMVSGPKSSRASRSAARRGDIFMMISHKPGFKIRDEVSIDVGYPIRVGTELTVQVDGKRAEKMFTEGDTGWAYDPRQDAKLVSLMKAGINLVVRGTSQRGTNTTDTYSLRGFTAAYNAISRACRA